MSSLSKKESQDFLETVMRIPDERVAYFYMMLGSALAEASSKPNLTLQTAASANVQPLRSAAKR